MSTESLETKNDEASEESNFETDSKTQYVDLSAEEARERLHRGEPLRGYRIFNLALNGHWPVPIRIERCHLICPRLTKGTFKENVLIVGSKIHDLRINHRAIFEKSLTLSGSEISKARLERFEIKEQFRAHGLRMTGPLSITNGKFCGAIKCWQGKFGGWLQATGSTFEDEVDLRSVHADEGISFARCTFNSNVLVRGAVVTKKLDFGDSRFDALLDLSKAKLQDYTYLEQIQRGPGFRLSIVNTVAERLLIHPEQIEGFLASENEGNFKHASREYGLMQSVYQTLHRHDEEDWAYYRFKVCQRRARPRSWWRPWSKLAQFMDWLFLDLGCGYGTNPFRAVGAAMILILLFGALYASGIHSFVIEEALVGKNVDGWANRLAFGTVTSVSVFTAGFTGDHLYNARGWMLIPLAVEALTGTLLWGFFVVAFSRKVIR